MRIARVIDNTGAEGIGRRFTVWLQGCPHKCRGCYATDMQPFAGGVEIDVQELFDRIYKVSSAIEGVTFLGGEPLGQAGELAKLAKLVKNIGLSVTIFTGYVYEYIEEHGTDEMREVLKYTDLLVDGPYMEEKRDFSRPLVGSSNQRFLFLTDRYSQEDIEKLRNHIEVRIKKDGIVKINGMGDFPVMTRTLEGYGMSRTRSNPVL